MAINQNNQRQLASAMNTYSTSFEDPLGELQLAWPDGVWLATAVWWERLRRHSPAHGGAEHATRTIARIAKRLLRHQGELFTFLDRQDADWDNNLAERMIRPAVILHKNSQCNWSERGAATQAVLMSIRRTLKLGGVDPRLVIAEALTALRLHRDPAVDALSATIAGTYSVTRILTESC